MRNNSSMDRREFLKYSTLGMVEVGFPRLSAKKRVGEKGPLYALEIKEYKTLGRTEFKVSDISAGEHQGDEGMLNTLLDAGVNYIDTGESYGNGRDERVIGQVIKNRDRKSVFITTKLYLRGDRTKSSIIERTRKCLEMSKYNALPTAKADNCWNCEGHCETACPYNVPIHVLLLQAHHRLTLAKLR